MIRVTLADTRHARSLPFRSSLHNVVLPIPVIAETSAIVYATLTRPADGVDSRWGGVSACMG
ncbi:MAG: hypothetical protein ACYCZN_15230 [Candidatus Dormibacteria bacterium]